MMAFMLLYMTLDDDFHSMNLVIWQQMFHSMVLSLTHSLTMQGSLASAML